MNLILLSLVAIIIVAIIQFAGQIDIHPQFMKMRIVESGTGTFTNEVYDTPIIIASSKAGSFVLEILKFYIWLNVPDIDLVTVKRVGVDIDLTRNVQTALLQGDNDDLIIKFSRSANMITSGAFAVDYPIVIDVQNADGKGILLADKQIHLAIKGGANSTGAYTANVWALYRLTPIKTFDLLQELIG